MFCFECNSIECITLMQLWKKPLLAGGKFMPEMHLKQPGFTYSACGPFTKNKERIETFMQIGNTNFFYKTELDKACFQHDMAYDKLKDLAKRAQSDKVLRENAFKIASDPKCDGCQRGLASMVYKFVIKHLVEVVLLLLSQIISWQMSFIDKSLENVRNKKFTHLLETIFGLLI